MPEPARPSRRGFLALGGAALVGAGAGGAVAYAAGTTRTPPGTAPPDRVAFHGPRQAGIVTPAQSRLAFAAYDLTVKGRPADNLAALRTLLKTWTGAAAAMADGQPVPGDNTSQAAPPADTGEAYGLSPANLTLTFGVGPSLFDGRFGLAGRRPAALADLPRFPGDDLDPARGNGDLCVQACAEDPLVAFHAVRNLARLARGTAVLRWAQLGFGNATGSIAGTGGEPETPRNLMGFKDGTRNIHTDDAALLDEHVWVGDETDQPWMRGGSYLVARRIRMLIEAWDRDYLADQENVIGRHKYSGAPLGKGTEFEVPDFAVTHASGEPVIPTDAHIRLAAHENNSGLRILRRGYSFTDGIDPASGQLDAGLFFLAYQKDPRNQFVVLQHKLSRNDALNEYIRHVGSGVFACPPGVRDGADHWASGLLG
jgi:deferrochelatase/peroxidase EfeB